MSTPIPVPLRAAAGLAAVAIDEARRLPERVVGLPVLAVSAALRASLKAQQRYAALVARGDQLLGQLRGQQDGPPAWARFDEEEDEAPVGGWVRSAFDAAPEPDLDAAAAALAAEADLAGAELAGAELAGAELAGAELAGAELAGAELAGAELDEAELDEAELDEAELDEAGLAGGAELAVGIGPAEVELAAVAAEAEAVAGELATDAEAGAEAEQAEQAAEAERAGLAEQAEAVEYGTAAAGGGALPEEEIAGLADDATAYDGYLAADPPLAGYEAMSIPQLRARLRRLSEQQLVELVAYERATAGRPPYLTMLENRLTTVRGR